MKMLNLRVPQLVISFRYIHSTVPVQVCKEKLEIDVLLFQEGHFPKCQDV